MTPPNTTGNPPVGLLARLKGLPDSEHEMSFNRLAFCLLMAAYLALAHAPHARLDVLVMAAYAAVAVAIFGHILTHPRRSVVRRLLAMTGDLGIVSWQLHAGGEATSVFFPLYLWVIFGNGFRFGISYLLAAMTIGIAGFASVVATTPFWRGHTHLSAGLLLGLFVLPLYAGRLIRKLSAATRQAEQASQAKSLFLASVSHELRTPLNAVIGMGDLLQQTQLDAEQKEMARIGHDAARALLTLIDGILDFSRIEAGQMPHQETSFELPTLLAETRSILLTQAQAKRLRLRLHVAAGTPVALRGDRRHLQEILLNLAGNAVKFTERGEVVIAVQGTSSEDGRLQLRVEVSDTGIGIASDAIGRIFEPFTQADATIINRFGGTGLGLAICRRLVGLLDGQIGVQSTPGAGSTFWVVLPMQVEAVPAAAPMEGTVILLCTDPPRRTAMEAGLLACGLQPLPAPTLASVMARLHERPLPCALVLDEVDLPPPPEQVLGALGDVPTLLVARTSPPRLVPVGPLRGFSTVLPPLPDPSVLAMALRAAVNPQRATAPLAEPSVATRRRRVLVADDNRINQRVVAMILERAGHEWVAVTNGEEALDALEQPGIDLVLMDLNMPVMDGLEATRLYRVMALGQPHVPVVGLTADARSDVADRCREAGMDACLTKPVEPARLRALVEELVPESALPALPSNVGDITAHPRFRPAGPAVDQRVLDELETLGGQAFVTHLIEDFLLDAAALIAQLKRAVVAGDLPDFRAQAHALRSGAANVGARSLYELCDDWRISRPQDLMEQGPLHIRRLAQALARLREALPEANASRQTHPPR